MGKLRAAKKSRGHYAAKKERNLDDQDSVSTSGLESVTLYTKEQSFKNSTSNNSTSKISKLSSSAKKPLAVPISNELVKKDESSPSTEKPGTAKKGTSKKDRRAARRQQWMKKLSNYQLPEKRERKKKDTHRINDMQSLVDTLPSLQEMGQNKKKVRKSTKKTLNAEINNFVQVLEHPAFKKDPLGTIHLHLTNARKRGLI